MRIMQPSPLTPQGLQRRPAEPGTKQTAAAPPKADTVTLARPVKFAGWYQSGMTKEQVEQALKAGNPIDDVGCYGNTALIEAAVFGKYDLVELLLAKGADMHHKNNNGNTALTLAAGCGKRDVVEFLLAKGADIHHKNNDGNTALTRAEKYEHHNVVELLKKRHLVWEKGVQACRQENTDAVHEILNQITNVNGTGFSGGTILMAAAEHGRVDVLRRLFRMGANLERKGTDGNTALGKAVQAGQLPALSELLERGAEVTPKDMRALLARVHQSKVEDDPVKPQGMTPLSLAAAEGKLDAIRTEAKQDHFATINQPDGQGLTPLMQAARHGHPQAAKLLLDYGADVSLKDGRGETAITKAARHGHHKALEVLLAHGATVTPQDMKLLLQRLKISETQPETQPQAQPEPQSPAQAQPKAWSKRLFSWEHAGWAGLLLGACAYSWGTLAATAAAMASRYYFKKPEAPQVSQEAPQAPPAPQEAPRLSLEVSSGPAASSSQSESSTPTTVPARPSRPVAPPPPVLPPEPEPIPLNHPEPSQAASSSSARPVSSQALQKAAHTLLQYLEKRNSLMDAPPEVRKSMSYQTSQEVARQLREKIQKKPREKETVLGNLQEQYRATQPYGGEADTERETRLFWHMVAQQVFGKTLSEIENKAPMGFNAVIGMEKEKEELMDHVVLPLNRFKQQEQGFKLAQAAGEWDDPDAYREEQPGGVLLYGEPGAGKSWLAERLAEELDMRSFTVDRASIIASTVGDSEKNLKRAFAQAVQQKPSVLIMNEIDSLLHSRQGPHKPEHQQDLTNQTLQELEKAPRQGVLVVGTTNRIDEIDSAALKRASRFSLKLPVQLPEEASRKEFFRYYLNQIKRSNSFQYKDEELNQLAVLSQGLNAEQIEDACKKADRQGRKVRLQQPSVALITREVLKLKSDPTLS